LQTTRVVERSASHSRTEPSLPNCRRSYTKQDFGSETKAKVSIEVWFGGSRRQGAIEALPHLGHPSMLHLLSRIGDLVT
jgi:hypothetical protein